MLQLGNLSITNIDVDPETNTVLFGVVSPENERGNTTILGEDLLFYDNTGVNLSEVSVSGCTMIDSTLDPSWDNLSNATNTSNNYVVIFSGGGDAESNYDHYYGNVKSLYSVVTSEYNIPASNIYVLFADGTSTKADRPSGISSDLTFAKNSTVYSATYSNFQTVMTTVSGKMSSDSHLLVYSFDHGGGYTPLDISSATTRYGEELLITYPGSNASITGTQFATEMFKVKSGYVTVVAAQCFAGGMIDDVVDPSTGKVKSGYTGNAKFYGMSATNHYEYSFGEGFSAAFIKAIKRTSSGGGGLATTTEVFNYAKTNDIFTVPSRYEPSYANNAGEYFVYTNDEGEYCQIYEHPWGAGEKFSIFSLSSTVQRPDLKAYKPTSWGDRLVVGTSANATTTTSSITTTDNLYVNWTALNDSSVNIEKSFDVRLDVSLGNTIVKSTTETILQSFDAHHCYSTSGNSSWNLGKLAAGTYTIKMTIDSGGAITESDETNNSYSIKFIVSEAGLPDLTYGTPTGYSGAIVVSTRSGSQSNASVITTDNDVYISFGVINQGKVASGSFKSKVTLSGNTLGSPLSKTVDCSSLSSGTTTGFSTNGSFGKLVAGTYTVTLKIDSSSQSDERVTESDEGNNTYSVTFTVYNASFDIAVSSSSTSKEVSLADYLPYNISGNWVFSKATTNSMVTGLTHTRRATSTTSSLTSASKTVSGALGFDTLNFTLTSNGTTSERSYSYTITNGDAVFVFNLIQDKGIPDDSYEDNDTYSFAESLGTLTAAKTITGLVLAPNDEDWFRFTTNAKGTSNSYITVTYSHVSSSKDIDVQLYSSTSSVTPILKSSGNTGTERISLENLDAGTYYIRVYTDIKDSTIPNYALTINPPNKVIESAVPLTVTSLLDDGGSGTLRRVLETAAEGSTIKFASNLSGGKITLNQGLTVNKTIKLDASSLTNAVTLSYTGDKLLFVNDNVAVVDIVGIKLTGSNYGIFVNGGSQVSIKDCVISGCLTGVYSISGILSLTDTTVENNRSAGICNYSPRGTAKPITTITSCKISGNGDGIFNGQNATIDIYNSSITDNTGYGIANYSTGDLTVRGCTIAGNYRGIAVAGGIVNISNTILVLNKDYNANIGESVSAQEMTAINVLSTSNIPWSSSIDIAIYDPSLPLFTDPSSGDYSLVSGSQAIGGGNSNYSFDCYENSLRNDLAGNARLGANNSLDIGAFQYNITGSLDVDGDGKFDTKDVNLLKRYYNGYKGDTIANGLSITNSIRNTGTAIYEYIMSNESQLDINGDKKFNTTDINLIKRYLLGHSEDNIANGISLGSGSRKDASSVYRYISRLIPSVNLEPTGGSVDVNARNIELSSISLGIIGDNATYTFKVNNSNTSLFRVESGKLIYTGGLSASTSDYKITITATDGITKASSQFLLNVYASNAQNSLIPEEPLAYEVSESVPSMLFDNQLPETIPSIQLLDLDALRENKWTSLANNDGFESKESNTRIENDQDLWIDYELEEEKSSAMILETFWHKDNSVVIADDCSNVYFTDYLEDDDLITSLAIY